MANRFDILIKDRTPISLGNFPVSQIAQSTPVTGGINVQEAAKPIVGAVESVFPGIAAIRESVQQKTLAPYLEFEKKQLEKFAKQTPEEFALSAGLAVGLTRPIRQATQPINEIADTALSRLISVIKQAKPARKGIEQLASAERGVRAGKAAGVLEAVEGEEAFIKAKGQLKGELVPKERKIFEIKRVLW